MTSLTKLRCERYCAMCCRYSALDESSSSVPLACAAAACARVASTYAGARRRLSHIGMEGGDPFLCD